MIGQCLLIAAVLLTVLMALHAQSLPVLNDQENVISNEMGPLRSLTDEHWTKAVGSITGKPG
jgi:hypothetical protein